MKGIIVSPVVTHPTLAGNSARVKQMVNACQAIGADIHFILSPIRRISHRKQSDHMNQAYGARLTELNKGKTVEGTWQQRALVSFKKRYAQAQHTYLQDFMFEDGYITDKLKKEFETQVNKINPDFIIVEYAILSRLITDIAPDVIKLVDTHDRFSDRNQRIRAAGGQGLWFSLSPEQEKKLLERFDHVLSIQSNETAFFQHLLNRQTSVHTLSILEPAKRTAYINHQPFTIGFIGSQNSHNEEGLATFLQQHWQTIKQAFPQTKLKVAGAKYDALMMWQNKGVEFCGRLDSLDDFYDDCTFFINPCITGSGLKIKSVEALSYGKPLVTTPEGTEGLEDAIDQGLYCYTLEDKETAHQCIALLSAPELATQISARATGYINKKYQLSLSDLTSLLSPNR